MQAQALVKWRPGLFTTGLVWGAVLSFALAPVGAQDCRLQIRCSGFTAFKYYAVLKISFAATTNSCGGAKAAVEWSDDLMTWNPVTQAGGLPCVTPGAEVQVIDETDARSRGQRFYRVRHAGLCP